MFLGKVKIVLIPSVTPVMIYVQLKDKGENSKAKILCSNKEIPART